MADVVRQVEHQFTIADKATAALNKIHSGALKVDSAFNKASATVVKMGGIAAAALGGFAIGGGIASANQYLRTVRDISSATGFTASGVDSVLEAMGTVNIAAEEGQGIIEQMSIAMQRYRMEVEKSGKAQSDAAMIIERMGLNMEKGPEAVFVRMAEMAEKGKISMADLNIAFQVAPRQASSMLRLLQQGPEAVGKIMMDLQKRGIAVNATNIAAFNKFEKAQIAIKSAWDRIFILVAGRVMPVIGEMLEGVAGKIDSWAESAAAFGETLGKFLKEHLDTVIMIGKVMAANAILQKATGMGIGGAAMRLGGGVSRMVGGGAAAAATTAAAASPAVIGRAIGESVAKAAGTAAWVPAGAGAAARGGPVSRILASITRRFKSLGPIMKRVGGVFAVAGPGLLKFGALIFRFTAIGAIITAIIAMTVWTYQAIRSNTLGIRDIMLDWWDRIRTRALVVWDIIGPMLDSLGRMFSVGGPVGNFFVKVLIGVINHVGFAVDNILLLVQTIIIAIRSAIEDPTKLVTPLVLFMNAAAEAQKLTAERFKAIQMERELEAMPLAGIPGARGAPTARPPAPVFDFRGSKFDIKQQFAEGFDPDRIAVAFSNDLAALGERRVQSGLAPLFSVR